MFWNIALCLHLVIKTLGLPEIKYNQQRNILILSHSSDITSCDVNNEKSIGPRGWGMSTVKEVSSRACV